MGAFVAVIYGCTTEANRAAGTAHLCFPESVCLRMRASVSRDVSVSAYLVRTGGFLHTSVSFYACHVVCVLAQKIVCMHLHLSH